MSDMFGKFSEGGVPINFKGQIMGAGYLDHKEQQLGTYYFIKDLEKKNTVYNCIKEKGVYDSRQVDLKVEVTGRKKDDMVFVDSIKQLEER